MNKLELWYPVRKKDFLVNQKFGLNYTDVYKNLGMVGHNGIDFYALDGFPVYAAHDGEVTYCGEDGGGGLGVVIRTLEPKEYKGGEAYFKSIYWHLKKGSFKVKAGEKVTAGHIIAEADNTGMSTGAHLHFGIKPVTKGEADWAWFNLEPKNGYFGAIDPQPYFNKHFASDAQFVMATLQKMLDLLNKFLKK